MKCWICNKNEANSREHKAKRSDVKGNFGNVSSIKPLHFRSEQTTGTVTVRSSDSNKLKFRQSICQRCNDTRTQASDEAWERLSRFLRVDCHPLKRGDHINLRHVFPESTNLNMRRVHLYFVKLFGCAVCEENVRMNLNSFSRAIMGNSPHPLFYLSFGTTQGVDRHVAASNLIIDERSAQWIYSAGTIAVHMIYSRPGETCDGLTYAWHPKLISDELAIQTF